MIILFSTIIFTIAIVWLVNYVVYNGRIGKELNKLPGPKLVPIFGNVLELAVPKEERMGIAKIWDKRYGPIYRTWIGPRMPSVHLMRPEHIEVVLTSTKHIKKGIVYELFKPWLGEGLLTTKGEKWFKHRKILTPAFHFKILDNFIEIFNENSQILVNRLSLLCDKGEEFDVFPYVTHCALDTVCECAMGVKINAQKNEKSDYVTAVYRAIELVLNRANGIKIWEVFNCMYYTFSSSAHEFLNKVEFLHQFAASVIEKRISSRRNNNNKNVGNIEDDGTKRRKAFLDILLDAAEDKSLNLTIEEIREEVDTFMFAGHDTTTAAVCWTLFLLGNHPEFQEQAYQEQLSIFSDDLHRSVTMKDLNEMKFLERVMKESLRLFPSVPFIGRTLEEDLQLGDFIIPSGVQIVIHIHSLHNNPELFPDADKFNPDNFLLENTINRHPYSYIPFSAGPRNCIGQKFAMLEEKAILSRILRNFKVHSKDDYKNVKLIFEVILRPVGGVKLTLSRRE